MYLNVKKQVKQTIFNSGIWSYPIPTNNIINFKINFRELKLPDSDITKYGLMSGLWNTAFSIGDIMGPTLGGAMLSKLGFEDTCGVFGLILVFLVGFKFVLDFWDYTLFVIKRFLFAINVKLY